MSKKHRGVIATEVANPKSLVAAPAQSNDASDAEGERRFELAFESVRSELAKLPDDQVFVVNLNIPAAAMLVRGRVPTLQKYRDEILATMRVFDIATFDKIETYALAAWHAHTRFLAASEPPQAIPEMVDQLTSIREVLASDVSALAKRGMVDGAKLTELQGPTGFKNLASDVMLLTRMVRDQWSKIQGKTAVELSELSRAEDLADRLTLAVSVRDQEPANVSEASDTRARAFTLFVKAYDEAQRVLSYLRWHHDDLDSIAPSLYANRGPGRRKGNAPNDAGSNGGDAPAEPRVPDVEPTRSMVGMPDDHPFGR